MLVDSNYVFSVWNNLEYFDHRFALRIPYMSIQILHSIVERKYPSVILWNNLEYFDYRFNLKIQYISIQIVYSALLREDTFQ